MRGRFPRGQKAGGRRRWLCQTGRVIDFNRRADAVAPYLLGAIIRRGKVAIRLTEVEAYLGPKDPASHAVSGPSGRAAVMFGPARHVYVYSSYGIHLSGNIVCSPDGTASGVLMRAGEVVEGVDQALTNRGFIVAASPDEDQADAQARRPEAELAKGPGNFGAAIGLSLADNGQPLGGPDDLFELHVPDLLAPEIWVGPRVGITKARDEPLRFWLPDEPSVSSRKIGSPWTPREGPFTLL